MNRFVLCANLSIAIDTTGADAQVVVENLYSRLSELAQSDEHFLDCDISCYPMPGNNSAIEGAVTT